MEEFQDRIEMNGLMLGANLTAEKVKEEVCPQCSFQQPICKWRLNLWLADSNTTFVCPGMRVWIAQNN